MRRNIGIESEPGKDTKFSVTLPFGIRKAAEAREVSRVYDTSAFAGKRILLAEDNELNAEVATAILEDAGFAVDHAGDGTLCVDKMEKAEAGYYDLILMDIHMPDMDGYEAATAIRRLPNPEKANIPIVAITTDAFAEDVQKAFDFGMNGHVAKPIEIDKLLRTIAGLLRTEKTAQ